MLLIVDTRARGPEDAAGDRQQSAKKIGITFTARTVEGAYPTIQTVAKNIPIAERPGWGKDYADPYTFFSPLFDGRTIIPTGNTNYSLVGITPAQCKTLKVKGNCDNVPSVNAELDKCANLVGAAHIACYAALDKKLMTQVVPWVPYLWSKVTRITSKNVTQVPVRPVRNDTRVRTHRGQVRQSTRIHDGFRGARKGRPGTASDTGTMLIYIARRLAWTVSRHPRRALHHLPGLLQAAGRRPGAPLRGQVADGGVARRCIRHSVCTSTSRSTSSSATSSRTSSRETRTAGPGSATPTRLRAGQGSDHRAGAENALADLRRRDHLAPSRGRHRRALRGQAAIGRRSRGDGVRALRHLGAGVLARPDGALHLLAQAPLDGRHGLRRRYRTASARGSRT